MKWKQLIVPLLLISVHQVHANDIQVKNVNLVNQNFVNGSIYVQFDLSWMNSWRTDNHLNSGVSTWDAAWVFVKFRVNEGNWQHATLQYHGHSAGTGTPARIQPGLVDETTGYHSTSNPAVGVFFERTGVSTGTFAVEDAQLLWNYRDQDVDDNDMVDVLVFAIEMVYVAPGAFYIGSGGSEDGAFYKYPVVTNPYWITSENSIIIGQEDNALYYNQSPFSFGDQQGPVPTDFPKGYAGFYSMKYEITQQQYVDFLNTLTQEQADVRYLASSGSYRNAITGGSVGEYFTSNPYVACNFLSWNDGTAYMDWAGMRPMTELEFEKACRGIWYPVQNEYAWGTNSIADDTYILANPGAFNENISANYHSDGSVGNANVEATTPSLPYRGPLRAGIFAANALNSGRVSSGASWYGIMELSGNLFEITITVGNPEGRAFTGLHGNGTLSTNAQHDVDSWPSGTGNSGCGFRGGMFQQQYNLARVSDRALATVNVNYRFFATGYRAVRSSPFCGIPVYDIDGNFYNTILIGDQCWMKENLNVTKDPIGNNITRYCYDDIPGNCDLYGGLYDWSTATDILWGGQFQQGICPFGWHIPGLSEWQQLEDYIESEGVTNLQVGNTLKSCRQVDTPLGGNCLTSEHPRWDSDPAQYGTDAFGFAGYPGGVKSDTYFFRGKGGNWWTATESDESNANSTGLRSDNGALGYKFSLKSVGYSVRCVRNQN